MPGKRKVAALAKDEADLAGLQNRIRKDPRAYEVEFLQNWRQYQTSRDQFLASPASDSTTLLSFREQIDFLSHVANLYFPDHTSGFADDLKEILTRYHAVLESELREKIVSSLVLLRRKEMIDSSYLLTTLIPILVTTPSKSLRTQLFQKIISDLRNTNTKATNHKLNSTVQTALFTLVQSDSSSSKGLWAVKITREMWKRQLWTNAKPVDIMRLAALSDNEKVAVGAVRFFLGGDQDREQMEDDSSDGEVVDIRKVKHNLGINKKTKKQLKALDKAVDKVKKQERKKQSPHQLNFSALHLLHDPQIFAESLFQKHLQSAKIRLAVESRLAILQLVTRLIGLHKLTVISLYSWFTKFLTPRQQHVTSFLASLAQATHNLTPPDLLEPLVIKIANEFVSEASAPEVASAGLNGIREICARQPLAMNDALLQDLVQYRKSKDKGVSMAARGLLSLFRREGADLLAKRDRGKQATMELKSGELKQHKFGEEEAGGIEGLELLEKWKEAERERKKAERGTPNAGEEEANQEEAEEEDDGWEVASMDSSDSGDWIRVSDSEPEEEEPDTKKQKRSDVDHETEGKEKAPEAEETKVMSKLATSQILTPADLKKLAELRMEGKVDKALGSKKKRKQQEERGADDAVTVEQIEAAARLRKSTKEEMVAMAKSGKPDREEHKSSQAIRQSKKEAEGKSSTNREKARKKNFFMTLGKAKSKQKRSLQTTRNVLKNHIARSKSGGRRRNGASK